MKYKFRLLIAMMLISLSSFSQIDTKILPVPNNDSVKLHINVAKMVVKDLMLLDALRKERVLLLDNMDTLRSIANYKDTIIGKKDYQIKMYTGIIKDQEQKNVQYAGAINQLESELRKQRFQKRIPQIALLLAVGFIILK